ncbi:MAG: hypothetical protein KDB21_08985 [Acidimicrobiales bacterium]|nr:hypothetical protein [Acidimicrobiales bacterium]
MRRFLAVVLLALALIAVSCGDDDDGGTTSTGADDAAEDATVTPVPAADDSAPEPTVDNSAPEPTVDEAVESDQGQETEGNTDIGIDTPGFAASIDDPVYVDLVLDCWYGENEADSCAQLEAAGLSADDAYGLGNSYSQTPPVFLREDCLNGDGLSCAELRVQVELTADGLGAAEPTLMCLFYSAVFDGVATTDLDFFHLTTLMGPDAPPGVQDALTVLQSDPGNAEAMQSLDDYLGPICAPYME